MYLIRSVVIGWELNLTLSVDFISKTPVQRSQSSLACRSYTRHQIFGRRFSQNTRHRLLDIMLASWNLEEPSIWFKKENTSSRLFPLPYRTRSGLHEGRMLWRISLSIEFSSGLLESIGIALKSYQRIASEMSSSAWRNRVHFDLQMRRHVGMVLCPDQHSIKSYTTLAWTLLSWVANAAGCDFCHKDKQ